MSGSSLDGVDVVTCTFTYTDDLIQDWSIDKKSCFSLPKEFVQRIISYKELDAMELRVLDIELGSFFADCIIKHAKDDLRNIQAAGVHGQTIYHLPEKQLTCQLGNGVVMQSKLQIPLVSDFRTKDIVSGGVGTPMAPLADDHLFPSYDFYLNLGGIANLSYQDAKNNWIAYDISPFNQYSNYFAAKAGLAFDTDGTLGSKGVVQQDLVEKMLSYPYFSIEAPKSLDNNWIVEEFIPSAETMGYAIEDSLASFYVFVSKCILASVKGLKEGKRTRMFVTGGGAYNVFFIELLRDFLQEDNIELVLPEKEIIDYKEAILIALATSFKLIGKPNFYSSVTGAKESVCGGVLFD